MSLKFTEISFEKIKSEVEYYLQTAYNKAGQLFSIASPFGQILNVVENLHQLSIMYLQKSMNQYDLSDPNSNNYNIVRTAAIVAGHNPARSTSASGVIRCQVNVDVDIDQDIPNSQIRIKNKTTLKNTTNNLFYHIDMGGAEDQVFNIRSGSSFFLNVVQGEWKTSRFTSDGTINQSYEVNINNREIENTRIEVTVNDEYWVVKKHLYEFIPDEAAVAIKTSFNGGITVVFGNGNHGLVPPINSIIKVSYVETDGANGNIYRKTGNDWKFIDDVIGGDGLTIEFEKLFNTFIYTDINFGANGEDINLMKNLLPLSSNNFVLALPAQYAYAIKKLGVFSHVNAYLDNGTIKIIATPNIKIFKNRNADYYTVDKRAFELDDYEKTKLDQYLRAAGYIKLTQKYRIDTPVLSYYVMYINLRLFDNAIEDNIKSEIVDATSEYFLNLNRIDRIPKKDLIKIIGSIVGVDSVDIRFVCKKNEDYHKKYLIAQQNIQNSTGTTVDKDIIAGYDKTKSLGIDKLLGDIVFESNEYPVVRGGWIDRNDIYYTETPLDGFSSINITVQGYTPRKNVGI